MGNFNELNKYVQDIAFEVLKLTEDGNYLEQKEFWLVMVAKNTPEFIHKDCHHYLLSLLELAKKEHEERLAK